VKILFVGVFDNNRKSTNTSQILAFSRLGHEVVGYNYREKAKASSPRQRDIHLLNTIKERDFDLVVFSKCNGISFEVFEKSRQITKTCLWFMDPLRTYDEEMKIKTRLVSYFCCDKRNVLPIAISLNKNSFYVCEGYDEEIDRPHEVKKEFDVSFIGNLYGDRKSLISQIEHKVKILNSVYGEDHAIAVSKSRINLNFCTDFGASDRVYKIMAAGGFLLSNDWEGRKENFIDGEDCVIFDNIEDLNKKINYYLKNPKLLDKISKSGRDKVKILDRLNWASKIVELSKVSK